ncbi:MAG: hypothetical protein K6G72_01880 [Lachnospiraceae bacterium]|nr:hypothetical protein [Lachnospiraceae bacterium]
MAFENDRDHIMRVSLSERFADLDEYIAQHYEEPVCFAAEESVAFEPEEKRKFGFGRKNKAVKSAMKESASCDAFVGAQSSAMPMATNVSFGAVAAQKPQKSLEDVVSNLDKSFMELVFTYADDRGINDVELQKKACINRKAFSKLKCGTTRNPSKPTALCFAIALELSLDETRDLLSRAGLALSPCSKQDVIVQYFIEKEAYDIDTINEALFVHGVECIGDVEA